MIDFDKTNPLKSQEPLVSVIITCYNQGKFLPKAIESVLGQTYPTVEIILVDDGSTDETAAITKNYPPVRYIFHENQGLSAARNTGIKNSHGECLLFLDADDWLYPQAITQNISIMHTHPDAMFVSGAHTVVDDTNTVLDDKTDLAVSDYYMALLHRNYIGMHASVLYRRKIFTEFQFDESLKACEDYDLYLKIARKYPVIDHAGKIAFYRKHGSNMSNDFGLMLTELIKVMDRQEPFLRSDEEKIALEKGKLNQFNKYTERIYTKWKSETELTSKEKEIIKKHPGQFRAISGFQKKMKLIFLVKKYMPGPILKLLFKMGILKIYPPIEGKVDLGDFNRLTPFDSNFGYKRGGPVDRVYIEKFLNVHAANISGRVLEIGDNEYTLRFGGEKITHSDILHVDEHNPKATYTGDLSKAPVLPDHHFDCVILTQTLHLIYDFKGALQTCRRILKPGGVLLLTVPGISPIDKGEWGANWYWSFTKQSIEKLSAEIFAADVHEINAYGNVFAATAFLYGMGAPELTEEQLFFQDPQYPVIITLKVTKESYYYAG